MFYLISRTPLYELKQLPRNEFLKNDPLSIKRVEKKTDLANEVGMDIAFISLCYSCPLYVYMMTDSYYFSETPFESIKIVNFGKVTRLFDLRNQYNSYDFLEADDLRVPLDETYFRGDVDIIQQVVGKAFSSINLRSKSLYSFLMESDRFESL